MATRRRTINVTQKTNPEPHGGTEPNPKKDHTQNAIENPTEVPPNHHAPDCSPIHAPTAPYGLTPLGPGPRFCIYKGPCVVGGDVVGWVTHPVKTAEKKCTKESTDSCPNPHVALPRPFFQLWTHTSPPRDRFAWPTFSCGSLAELVLCASSISPFIWIKIMRTVIMPMTTGIVVPKSAPVGRHPLVALRTGHRSFLPLSLPVLLLTLPTDPTSRALFRSLADRA